MTGARPKKRSQNRTIVIDSDTASPSTSRSAIEGRINERSTSRSKSKTKQVNRRSSNSSTTSPKKKIKTKNGKSLKQRLRETVLDEGDDWRQRIRHLEEKNRQLTEKLDLRKRRHESRINKVGISHKRDLEAQAADSNAKITAQQGKHLKEKSKLEKELKDMAKKAEKAELELSKAVSVKSAQDSSGACEALFKDVLGNLRDFLDGQLQCSICNEIFVYPSIVSCGHTFCEDCIESWKKKQESPTCPICRADVIMTSSNQALDGFIEKFIDNFFPEESKKTRKELVAERKKKKNAREAEKKDKNEPLLSQITRRRILQLESDDDDDDDDSWDGFGFR